MKKLMFALGVATLCASVQAVESANVVGYTSATLEANKFYLIAAQFQDTTGTSVDLQDFIKSSDMAGSADFDDETAPNLKIWNGNNYDDYFFWAEDYFGEENVWCDGGMKVDDVSVDIGNGAFLKVKNACTITVAGQVAAAATLKVPLTAGVFNLIANPYPIAFDINGTAWDCKTALPAGTQQEDETSPNIKIWNGSSYEDYYFWAEDYFGEENVWCDSGMKAENVVIQPLHGFWLKYTNSAEDVDLTFTK